MKFLVVIETWRRICDRPNSRFLYVQLEVLMPDWNPVLNWVAAEVNPFLVFEGAVFVAPTNLPVSLPVFCMTFSLIFMLLYLSVIWV